MNLSRVKSASWYPLFMQLFKFAVVGGAGFVVTAVSFNLLRVGPLNPEHVKNGVVIATVIATTLAIITNWLGNRFWTFATHRSNSTVREGVEFFAVSFAGMGISTLCVWVSHDVLGFTSAAADNIALNGVGLILGSVFRFVLYRYWVFSPNRDRAAEEITDLEASAAEFTEPDIEISKVPEAKTVARDEIH
ncbi:GtrA family protein [Mycetocola saprophilus]|uniref:GtrA family protein n=1 Tax=Mycetocola saprophilus TaxID=76636 RepID=UPI0006906B93|nr:GtrA family protein [Mycetocola saprophilus]